MNDQHAPSPLRDYHEGWLNETLRPILAKHPERNDRFTTVSGKPGQAPVYAS